MRAPILMLAWEIWRRNYKYACLAIAAIPGYLLFYWAIHSHVFSSNALGGISFPWMLLSLFWVVATFNYTEVNSEKGWTGFPCRLFVLPVPTVILVLLPMLLGAASVGLLCLVWLKFIFAPLGAAMPSGLAGWLAGWLVVDLACFQAIVWSLAGYRITRTVVLALAGFVLLIFEGCTYGLLLEHRGQTQIKDRAFWVGCLVLVYVGLALLAFVGAWYAVARQRRGGGRGRGRLKACAKRLVDWIIDALPGGKKPFASPLAAQFWFEWRQGGVFLPICAGCVLLLFLGPVSWLNRGTLDGGRTVGLLALILLMPIFLGFVIGKGFAKPDFWSMNHALKPFMAVRPLSAGEMVLTKMKVAALGTVVTWLLVLAAVPLWVALWVNPTTLKELSESEILERFQTFYSPLLRCVILALSVGAAMVLTWRGMVGSLWTGLSGRWTRMVGSAVLQGVVMVALLVALFHVDELPRSQYQTVAGWCGWALAVAVMVKLGAAVWSWDAVSRRHLSSKSVAKYLLVWAGGTLGLVSLVWLLFSPDFFSFFPVRWLKCALLLAALLAFPLARVGLAPLSLAQNRRQ
jgi:hypothetical protein